VFFPEANLNFEYAIEIEPLGMLYGSAGAFLSPENLVGRSGSKFPPDAGTVAGLITRQTQPEPKKCTLQVAGPFWSLNENIYVPIPWKYIIGEDLKDSDEWYLKKQEDSDQSNYVWQRKKPDRDDISSTDLKWQTINSWNASLKRIRKTAKTSPWRYNSILHPSLEKDQRCVKGKDGLFLENSIQMDEGVRLFYLSTESIPNGWYRFGGESHLVEVQCELLKHRSPKFDQLLHHEDHTIQKSFALITPGVWGSNRLSYRYPQNWQFGEPAAMLTDKPIPWRYRLEHRLQRGRYAVPPGSVYVLKQSIDRLWRDWPEAWFPKEGLPLKNLGCGLALPIDIEGLEN